MQLKPINTVPKKDEFISTVVEEVARWSAEKGNWAQAERERRRRRRRFGLCAAGLSTIAGLVTLLTPSSVDNFADSAVLGAIAHDGKRTGEGPPERKPIIERAPQKTGVPSRDIAASHAEVEGPNARTATLADVKSAQFAQASAAVQNEALEPERRLSDAIARDLILTREEGKAFQAAASAASDDAQKAQGSVNEQRDALEPERRRGDALAQELASAREEVEALTAHVGAIAAALAETERTLQGVVTEQKEALERERQRGESLARELASARDEVESLTASIEATIAVRSEIEQALQGAQASAAGQKEALERERRLSGAIARDLIMTREEVKALQAAASAASDDAQKAQVAINEQKDALGRERQRADTLALELTSAREEAKAFKAAAGDSAQKAQASVEEQKDALERERRRGDAFAQEFASARGEVEALTAVRSEIEQALQGAQASAADQKEAFERERQRADALALELTSAREETQAFKAAVGDSAQKAQASADEQKDAIERERRRGDGLAQVLASARVEVEALTARVGATAAVRSEIEQALQGAQASAADQKEAFEPERQRADALALELASAAAGDSAQKAQASAAEQKEAFERERRRADTLAQELASARAEVQALTARVDATTGVGREIEQAMQAREPQVAAVGDGTRALAPALPSINKEQIAVWVTRGEGFVALGDFVSARVAFQRAAEAGDAQAALMLAGTYDPNVLHRFGARGLAGDIAKAQFWYETARDRGSLEALRRLELLAQPRRALSPRAADE